ncbi:predicted protein [Botrytis cinerea T4]|uniref:Uncharacterized protein n=1 Tax=Botryotinia fuckeliana (strain T4) TaxID=999810 RepID=G2YQU8_BOTF4|nr:predicted protein [Botrytis cinerea T4]
MLCKYYERRPMFRKWIHTSAVGGIYKPIFSLTPQICIHTKYSVTVLAFGNTSTYANP